MSEVDIISASDARSIAEHALLEKRKIILAKIKDEIRVESAKGEMKCYINEYIPADVINLLKQAGYEVVNDSSQFNGTQYIIKW